MKLVAPVAGAGLYAWQGGGAVAALSAVMPVLAATLYRLLRLDQAPPGPSGDVRADGSPGAVATRPRGRSGLRDALAVLWHRRAVRIPVLLAAVAIGMSGFATAPLYARVTGGLDLPSAFLGILGSAQGAGSIVGGLAVGRLIARRGVTAVAAAGAILFAVGCVAWCLPWWAAMIGGSLAVGVGLPWTLIAGVTAVQTFTPDHLLGRVAATANTVMFGPIALTNPLGAAAVHIGARPPLVVAAVLCLIAASAALRGAGPAGREDRLAGARLQTTPSSGR